MSDITLDLSGVIALLAFIFAAAGFSLAAFISLIVAMAGSLSSEKGVRSSKAFGFFVTAIPFIVIDLIGVLALFYTVDSNSHDTNNFLDIAVSIWLLIQPVVWIAAAIMFNRARLK